MRFGWYSCVVGGFLLLGCNASDPPEIDRSDAERRFESSQSSEVASDLSARDLPEDHPPVKAAPADAEGSGNEAPGDEAASRVVSLDAITLTAPEEWTRKPPSSSFVAAEFALPKAEGDDADGRLTVSIAGGSIEANIERWKGQFTKLQIQHEEKIKAAGLEITLVEYAGEFNDQRGPFAPAAVRSGYRMIGAVIPVGEQLHFIKATGPQKTMAAHADKIKEFVRSVQTG